jgi:transposase
MERAPSRLPSHHPEPEAFLRCFQPPADTRFYAGVDRHARSLYLAVLDRDGQTRYGRNLPAQPEPFRRAVQPFRDGLVVGCACVHCWYRLADTCRAQQLPFVLGHAWAMAAVHGQKTKCDRHDALAIARLLKGGNFPLAYAYPKERRGRRDLLRARLRLVRQRAEL